MTVYYSYYFTMVFTTVSVRILWMRKHLNEMGFIIGFAHTASSPTSQKPKCSLEIIKSVIITCLRVYWFSLQMSI